MRASPGELVSRLDRGWDLIGQEPNRLRRDEMETFWIQLLHQYERACESSQTTEDIAA
jgi:hypothetical protein